MKNNVIHRTDTIGSLSLLAVVVIFVCAFILMIPVLVNGFPFIFPDSGDYLVFTPRLYRSPFYGLFIFFFHWNWFIWGPVIAQALIASHLIWLTLGVFTTYYRIRNFFISIIILTAFSSLPFFVGFIMADLFTAIMFLVMYLIAFHFEKLGFYLRFYLLLLGCVAMAANIANLTMAFVMLILLTILFLWCSRSLAATGRRMVLLSIPIVLTAAATLLNNVVIHHTFSLSPAGQSFFMANLIEYGPAEKYLKEVCPGTGYKICAYVDRFPITANGLLWETGIFQKLGGFKGMKDESERIVAETIKRYPVAVAQATMHNIMRALVTWEPGAELMPEVNVPSMNVLLTQKFGAQANTAYMGSMEMQGLVPHKTLRIISYTAVSFSLIIFCILTIICLREGKPENVAFIMFIVCSVLCDAVLCASLSGVYDRYQARVTWLLIFAAILLVLQRVTENKLKQAD